MLRIPLRITSSAMYRLSKSLLTIPALGYLYLLSASVNATVTGQDSFNGSESEMYPGFYRAGAPDQPCYESPGISPSYRTYTFKTDGTGGVGASINFGNCGQNLYATFHEGDFNPNNICSGFSWSYGSAVNSFNGGFSAPQNTVMTMVISSVSSTSPVCGNYSYSISGATAFNRNIAIRKLKAINSTKTGGDSWQASYVYNADRRDANIFNPGSDDFSISFGNKTVTVPAGSFIKLASGVLTYTSPANTTPSFSVKITPSKQIIDVKVSKIDDFGFALPDSNVSTEITLGKQSFGFTTKLTSSGTYAPFYSYQNDNFSVLSATMSNVNSHGDASVKFKSFLESPRLLSNFAFSDCANNCNHPSVILLMKENGQKVVYKDMSNLVSATKKIDAKTGKPIYTLKKSSTDTSANNNLSSFSYNSKTGALSLAMSKVYAFRALTFYQAPLTVELVINGDTFNTDVTMFATDTYYDSNSYSSAFTKVSPLQ